jgi:hypothetical protein
LYPLKTWVAPRRHSVGTSSPRPSGYDEAVQICEAIPAGPSFEKRQRQMVVQVAKLFDSMNAQAGVHVSQVDPQRS